MIWWINDDFYQTDIIQCWRVDNFTHTVHDRDFVKRRGWMALHDFTGSKVSEQSKIRIFYMLFYIQHYLFAFVCVNSTVLFYLLVSFSIQEFIPLKLLVVDIILLKETVTFKMAAEFWQTGCAEIILSRCSKACLRGSRIAVDIKDVILTVKHLRWPSLLFINRCGSWW